MRSVLYITYIDITTGTAASGSSVRPRRIYESFIEKGYDVTLLEGAQLRNRKEERLNNISTIEEILNKKDFDYCYIELPTTPITFKQDLALIKKIWSKGIKIGIYYRDFHWKYPEIWQAKGIKKIYYWCKYKRELKTFKKYASVIFFPTEQAILNFQLFENMRGIYTAALPPGMQIAGYRNDKINNNLIYVGGISNLYKIELFLEALKRVNENGFKIDLTLVCRFEELQRRRTILEPYLKLPWLNIIHTSDPTELKELYKNADMGISSLSKIDYADMSMPIKIGEYLSNGLPIIATASKEIAKMIKKYKCGIVCDFNVEDIQNKIEEIYSNDMLLKSIKNNIYMTTKLNSWDRRIDTLEKELKVQ